MKQLIKNHYITPQVNKNILTQVLQETRQENKKWTLTAFISI